ncbi:hypothetical protein ACIA49_15015 [Kribbella sp. NPDC051587]|uniref:hypothetical protein n=1 Tax=Kribbella sp. NPDC051587 TaxID=3364119 RepID=UPI00379CE0E3
MGDDEVSNRFGELRGRQAGAFSRTQALAHGVSEKVLQGRCRARQLQRVRSGVYADFTGPLPWETRMWAAWLSCGPDAALAGETSLRRFGVEGDWRDDQIHLAVPHARRLDPRPGVRVTRHRDFEALVLEAREPPMMRLEAALLMTAGSSRDAFRRASVLLDACRQRRTTPARLLTELDSLARLPGRQFLRQILMDAAEGVHSVLERTYLQRVERAHGLPRATRQVRVSGSGGTIYRDTEHEPYGVVVELDGQVGHLDPISRWRDMSRDNAAATSGKLTLRFGYQLVSRPCEAAAQVAAALQFRGWPGRPHPCSPTCPIGA